MESPPKKKIVLAGGSGFIGTAFYQGMTILNPSGQVSETETPFEFVTLSRKKGKTLAGCRAVTWDGKHKGPWWKEIDGCEAVINLAGRSINCIHDAGNKKAILESRLDSVSAIAEAVRAAKRPPKAWIQMGALGIFGDTRLPCDEDAPHGSGFMAEVCERWEADFYQGNLPDTRRVFLRMGLVLDDGGGALGTLQKLTRYYLGGSVGDGGQFLSWIHMEDLISVINRCLEDETIQGTFNVTVPSAITNRDFMAALRKAMYRPWCPPAPAWLIKIAAPLLLKTEAGLVLSSSNCVPKRLLDSGFQFEFPDLDSALADLL